jgi:hypothetical protein
MIFFFHSVITETMWWSEMQVDSLSSCRARAATFVGRMMAIIGGSEGAPYYNGVYVFEILTRRWSRPMFTTTDVLTPCRAHTTMLYQNEIWVFGGGNGLQALNDVWTLDVSGSLNRMRGKQVTISRRKRPASRISYFHFGAECPDRCWR